MQVFQKSRALHWRREYPETPTIFDSTVIRKRFVNDISLTKVKERQNFIGVVRYQRPRDSKTQFLRYFQLIWL